MAEREFKVYDRQDVIAATTLGADGAPLDGPEIVEGAPISRPASREVYQLNLPFVTDFGLKAQRTA